LRPGAVAAAVVVALIPAALGAWFAVQRWNSHPDGLYYVAATGDDSRNGTARRPWRTVQRAVDAAPSGATVLVGAGDYDPFVVTTPGLTVSARDGQTVSIVGRPEVRDVVRIAADDVAVRNLTVTGCRPNPSPDGFERNGSSGVRVDDGTRGVRVAGLRILDGRGTTGEGLPIGCYGVTVQRAEDATVEDTEISGTGYGVFVIDSRNVSVLTNTISGVDTIIRNTTGNPNDDFGGVAIGFTNTTGGLARGNTVHDNGGPSADYGVDGGGFEIYQSSQIVIEDNDIAANENILETGTGPGGDCVDNRFSGNRAIGHRPGARLERTLGMILRCGANMSLTGNRLADTDEWMFYLTGGDAFSSSPAGLTIRDNDVRQGGSPVYAVDLDPAQWSPTIDANRYGYAGDFARGWDLMPIPTLEDWRRLTGFDQTSVQVTG
jgi:nitrous oxidase accessory protein NosD